jgi:hypothetical protein
MFGRDKEDYEWVSMEQGMKIIIALSSDNPPKFIKIGNSLINTSSVASISQEYEKFDESVERRELTVSEQETYNKFNQLEDKLLLT